MQPVRYNNAQVLLAGMALLKSKLYNHFSGKESLKGDIGFHPEEDLEDSGKIEDFKFQLKENETFCLMITSDYYFAVSFVDNPRDLRHLKNDPLALYLKNKWKKREN